MNSVLKEEEETAGKTAAAVASCEAEIQGIDDKIQSLIQKVSAGGVDDVVNAYSKIRLLQAARSLMDNELCSLKEGVGEEVFKE
jgi:hypothetical protein